MSKIRARIIQTAFALTILTLAASACECAPPPPPCEAFSHSPLIFLGTVTSILEYNGEFVASARMRIDKAYKGIKDEEVTLFDNGMCDGPSLKTGEQYLMYTYGDPKAGPIPSRGCTRSRSVKYAEEDLKFLDGLSKASPTSTIFGQVRSRSDDYNGSSKDLAGVAVVLNGTGGQRTSQTDSEGRYVFNNLQPGEYTVAANQPGFTMLTFGLPDEAPKTKVEARGCAVQNIVLRKSWQATVRGRVAKADGTPGPSGLSFTLIRIESHNGKEIRNPLFMRAVVTGDDGQFSFPEVEPGRYKIVMNLMRFPTTKMPYREMYWPQARSESEASIIEVADSTDHSGFDFVLPAVPSSRVVSGVLLSVDGQPVADSEVMLTALPDGSIAEENENRVKTDASGRFSFEVLEGFEYEVRASDFRARPSRFAQVKFTLDREQPLIRLVLKPAQ